MALLPGMVPVLLLPLSLPGQAQQAVRASGGQDPKAGQTLFLKNCALCHGAKAQGGEGPNLHGLHLSSLQMTAMIKNGIKGEMPAFGNKLKGTELKRLVDYLQSLKK